jgi:hypothetical protein
MDMSRIPWTVLDNLGCIKCQRAGSQIKTSGGLSTHGFSKPDIQLTVNMGVLKSRHPADCQHMGSESPTVHGQSEFGKPSRCYLGSLGAWGSLGCPWDPRTCESDLQMHGAHLGGCSGDHTFFIPFDISDAHPVRPSGLEKCSVDF